MYHYVRPDEDIPPYYYHLSLSDFRAQLDFFEDKYGFVDRQAFIDLFNENSNNPGDGVVLTFDDGLLDHYKWVLPELNRRDLWGIFYVPTGPLVSGEVLDVHRIHALLGVYGGERVFQELGSLVENKMVPDKKIGEFREDTYMRQQNTEKTTLVKRILNYYVSYQYRSSLIDELVTALPAADMTSSDLYLNEKQLRALENAGMVIGSHSVTHKVLSKLRSDKQRSEIIDSFDYLDKVLDGLSIMTFCYPYGGYHTFTDETRRILNDIGCMFSFNVESCDIEKEDVESFPQALPRYDCNEFEHGDASGDIG